MSRPTRYSARSDPAIRQILARGRIGESYNVGGDNQKTNLEVVNAICALLDEARPNRKSPHSTLISFVKDRPGHDHRYAMDSTKISSQIGWKAAESFDSGLRKTVAWYLANRWWWEPIWARRYHGERLGMAARPEPNPSRAKSGLPRDDG